MGDDGSGRWRESGGCGKKLAMIPFYMVLALWRSWRAGR